MKDFYWTIGTFFGLNLIANIGKFEVQRDTSKVLSQV